MWPFTFMYRRRLNDFSFFSSSSSYFSSCSYSFCPCSLPSLVLLVHFHYFCLICLYWPISVPIFFAILVSLSLYFYSYFFLIQSFHFFLLIVGKDREIETGKMKETGETDPVPKSSSIPISISISVFIYRYLVSSPFLESLIFLEPNQLYCIPLAIDRTYVFLNFLSINPYIDCIHVKINLKRYSLYTHTKH